MRKLSLFIVLLFTGLSSWATHISGADFNYQCIGKDSFYITLNLFRDCTGIAAPASANVQFTSSCGQSFSQRLIKQNGLNGTEISQLCPGSKNTSTCSGGPMPGMQQHIYAAIVVLSPSCNFWSMQWSLCCRNSTINLVGQPELMVEATLYSGNDSCNTSPVFNAQPILYVCLNQNVDYNFAVTEADGDSLVYSFVDPLDKIVKGNIQTVPFVAGYNATEPISGITLNTSTGQLKFTPTIQGNFVLAVKVCEYDYITGELQGCVIRDIQFVIIPCANKAPLPPPNGISAVTGSGTVMGNDSIVVCVGNNFSFDIVFSDPNLSDSITLTTNISKVIPGATYVITKGNPATVTVSGTVTASMPSLSTFIVNAKDDACPIYATATSSYNIIAQPMPVVNAGGDVVVCRVDIPVTVNGYVANANGGMWSGAGAFGSANTQLANTYMPTVAELALGKVELVLTSIGNQNCAPVSDTIILNLESFNSVITTSTVDVLCNGGADGIAVVRYSGGNLPVSVVWNTSPTQVGDSATGLASGTYAATLTDSNGCDTTINVLINEPSALSASVNIISNVSCTGGNDGEATIQPNGGVAPYSYLWDTKGGNQTTATGFNLFAGNHNVTITDANGCDIVKTVTIIEPNYPMKVSVITTDVTCYNLDNGSALANVVGGTLPYSYNWGPSGQTTNPILNIYSGTYSITVIDSTGMCVVQTGIEVSEPKKISVYNTSTDVLCFGDNTGIASVFPIGGVTPFTYQWGAKSGNATSNSVVNLSSGTYLVTLTDANGCLFDTTVNVDEPNLLSATSSSLIRCSGGNGDVNVTPFNGVSPYNITWNTNPVQTGVTASNLTAGNYIVTIVDSNGCDTNVTINVVDPMVLTGAVISQVNVSCTGGFDGEATVSGVGGMAPYTYLWDSLANNQTTAHVNSLFSGTYQVTITDSLGCSFVQAVTITQPIYALRVSVSTTDITCNGLTDGTATALATGGTAPYQYQWVPSGSNTPIITGLSAGTSIVTVTDNSGQCMVQVGIDINEPLPLASTSNVLDVKCNNGNDGQAQIIMSGGVRPYSYRWDGGANSQTDSLARSLKTGSYSFSVTDNNGCNYDSSIRVSEPNPILISPTKQMPLCNKGTDGEIAVNVTGGIKPYTYLWGVNALSNTDSVVSLIGAGNYYITVTDSNLCVKDSIFTLSDPVPVYVGVLDVDSISCFGDSTGGINVVGAGGVGPFTYQWNTSSKLEPSGVAVNLGSGNYSVTITDIHNCTFDTSIVISQPAKAIDLSTQITNVSCYADSTGIIECMATGGTVPYTYLWDSLTNKQTTATAINLPIGSYKVLVTDDNGCQDSIITSISQPNNPLSVSISGTDILCHGEASGSAKTKVSGGTVPYTYQWNTLANNQITDTINTLISGMYEVSITDFNNCVIDTFIEIKEPLAMTVEPKALVNVNCKGDNTGSASILVNGGTTPYSYAWASSTGNQTNATAINLKAGIYKVSVTDKNGCYLDTNVHILEPIDSLKISAVTTPVNCYGGTDGVLTATVTGGTNPYAVQWSSNTGWQTGLLATNLFTGTYNAVVTDDNGCLDTVFVSMTQPSAPILMQSTIVNATCNGYTNGEATINASGGTAPYNIIWDAAAVNQKVMTASNLGKGTYEAYLVDANGCKDSLEVIVTHPDPIIISGKKEDVVCTQANFKLEVYASGGNGGYVYTWNNGLGNSNYHTVNTVNSNSYTVSVTDAIGCPGGQHTINITVNKLYQDSLTVWKDRDVCEGESANLYANYNGRFGPYKYMWSNGLGTGSGPISVSPKQTGVYQVTLIDQCQNQLTEMVIVNVLQAPIVMIPEIIKEGCGPLVVDFNDQIADSGNFSYSWDFGDGATSNIESPTHTFTDEGTYDINVVKTSSRGCSGTQKGESKVTVYPTPNAYGSADRYIADLTNPTIHFTDLSNGADSVIWRFNVLDSSTDNNPSYTYSDTGVYPVLLSVSNLYGCRSNYKFDVEVRSQSKIKVPDVFIPNADGGNGGTYDATSLSNEVFYARLVAVDYFHMTIHNRWGELVFESFDVNIGWDGYYRGELAAQDNYVWKIDAIFEDGDQVSEVGNLILLN